MPIPIKNGLSYPKTKIIYGDTRNKIQNQSSVPPIDFHAKTGLAVEYSIDGNMTQASTQEYSITDIPPIDFQSDGNGISDYSIYGNMVQASSQQYSLTGVSPLSFKSDANTLSAWSMSGNGEQTGTPTPDAPIMPEFVGAKTGNLAKYWKNAYVTDTGNVPSENKNAISFPFRIDSGTSIAFATTTCFARGLAVFETFDGSSLSGLLYRSTMTQGLKYTAESDCYAVIWVNLDGRTNMSESTFASCEPMLNTGQTALPYEPFGYKIPITNAGQTVTAYPTEPICKIGDYADVVDSSGVVTRSIKKLVLTGEENWIKFVNNNRASFYINVGDGTGTEFISTHFHKSLSPNFPDLNSIIYNGNTNKNMVFRMSDDTTITEVDDFKTYLAAQYAAGTPVTVWYVLATPTTETFTATTIPTTSGDNTLSIDTTLSPSSVSITTTSGVWPENPITPEECGDKTEQMIVFPYYDSTGTYGGVNFTVSPDGRVTASGTTAGGANFFFSRPIELQPETYTISLTGTHTGMTLLVYDPDVQSVVASVGGNSSSSTFTITETRSNLRIYFNTGQASAINIDCYPMLNYGSTPLPYEPYGKYKIPVTAGGQTQTIYLDSPIRKVGDYSDFIDENGVCTRSIKKLVLDGTESVGGSLANGFSIFATGAEDAATFCTHFAFQNISSWDELQNGCISNTISRYFRIKYADCEDTTAFKSYLAAQYAAGTPVCVWYVLATPTTESITSPTLSTTSGNNTLSIGTTLQPSNVSLTTSSSVYPLNPIIPEEVGDRTGNLFDKNSVLLNYEISENSIKAKTGWAVSDYIPVVGGAMYTGISVGNNALVYSEIGGVSTQISKSGTTFTVPSGTKFMRINLLMSNLDVATINLGSTALPYEPYGWKIPLNLNNTISNIYLSQPIRKIGNYSDSIDYENGTVTRKIKKLVLTGQETFGSYINPPLQRYGVYLRAADMRVNMGLLGYSTHFQPVTMSSPEVNGIVFGFSNDFLYFLFSSDTATSLNLTTLDNIKEWFQQQYENGNPVCVWYILSTPEVEQITPPTITPSIESNTISVDTTLQPSNLSITYTSPDYSEIKLVYDNQGNILYNDPPYHDWGAVRWIVRQGLGPQYYPIGYIFYDNFNPETGTAFQVVAYDNHFDPVLTAQGYTHSMTLCEVLLDDLVTFDAAEAFLFTDTALTAGTYKFTIPNYDPSYGGNKTYYFTSTANVPAGSQICIAWPYNQTPKTVTAYAGPNPQTNETAITGFNALTLTEWVDGTSPTATDLGTIAGPITQAGSSSYGQMNHIHRARYGSNNYLQSGVRQYINSNSTGGQWWQPQTIFDRPYGSRSSNGKLKKLNQDLAGVMAYPAIKSRTNSYFETNSLDGTILTTNTDYDIITDRMFLLSPVEVGFSTTDTTIGTLLDYYINATNDTRIKKRKSNNTAYYWWLRTPYPSNAYTVRRVNSSGALNNDNAYYSYGSAAACVIQ